MCEWDMVVGNLIPEMNFLFLQHQSCGNRVNRCVAPSLIEETTVLVQRSEIVNISVGPQPLQAANFKVGPLTERLERLEFHLV